MIDPCIYTECPYCEFCFPISSEDIGTIDVCFSSGEVLYGCKRDVKE